MRGYSNLNSAVSLLCMGTGKTLCATVNISHCYLERRQTSWAASPGNQYCESDVRVVLFLSQMLTLQHAPFIAVILVSYIHNVSLQTPANELTITQFCITDCYSQQFTRSLTRTRDQHLSADTWVQGLLTQYPAFKMAGLLFNKFRNDKHTHFSSNHVKTRLFSAAIYRDSWYTQLHFQSFDTFGFSYRTKIHGAVSGVRQSTSCLVLPTSVHKFPLKNEHTAATVTATRLRKQNICYNTF